MRNTSFTLWVCLKINELTLFEKKKMKLSQFGKNNLFFKFRKLLSKTKIMRGMVQLSFAPKFVQEEYKISVRTFFVAKITLLFKLPCINSQQYFQGSDCIAGK